jgi:hypothetical protein
MWKSGKWVWGVPVFICLLAQAAAAQPGSGESGALAAQLSQHYKLSTAMLSASGAAAIAPGAVLRVHRDGIVGFAAADQAMEEICPSEFREGKLYADKSALCALTAAHSRRVFKISEPVCVTAISASAAKETVSLFLVSCQGGKPALAAKAYYARLLFRFPKGYLESGGVAHIATQVEGMIDQVLSAGETATESPEQAVAPSAAPEPAGQGVPPLPPLPTPDPATPDPATPAPAEPPPTPNESSAAAAANSQPSQAASSAGVSVGQTPEQVKAILGEPAGVVDLGVNFTYLYPNHLKIFFVHGKVSKIQQPENNQ